jgi:hypothetical protein
MKDGKIYKNLQTLSFIEHDHQERRYQGQEPRGADISG